ncbi:unnamed protein product [Ilex paraguariensis]|uniref:DC1 domain-containing protein n=1 Tax=Ilex paraguariensis TaxID=185542 RepID=A0ABC8SWH5_9AQUA
MAEREITNEVHEHPLAAIFRPTSFFCDVCRIENSPFPTPNGLIVVLRVDIFSTGGENENEVDQSIDPNLLHLPVTDGFLELFRHFAKQINLENTEREAKLIHWSHEHPLILFNVQKDDDIKDEITLCDGCVQPISFPFYHCGQCNYFLHLSCVNLPQELHRPIHDEHPMKLFQGTKFYETFCCDACRVCTNGFFYTCETCEFILDVKCAFLPSSIAYQAHKHPMVQMNGSKDFCDGCYFKFSTSGFKCDDCKFKICHEDALLPRTIRHRWDKHPPTLYYPPFSDHPGISAKSIVGKLDRKEKYAQQAMLG